ACLRPASDRVGRINGTERLSTIGGLLCSDRTRKSPHLHLHSAHPLPPANIPSHHPAAPQPAPRDAVARRPERQNTMTRWAWVIDQTRCIGCHACTTACKSENDVPVGSFRTWVKNVEVGSFPEVKRHFAVLRCNHCDEPPCVEVCPVSAMYQRPDGLVDFNHDTCIGCKACMQACPYDAIYMDPDSNTAAKCNFCSHRVDEGLLPACVVVCPEEALLFGDLEDPTSKVRIALKTHDVTVRRPEQGTKPHAFYIGAEPATLDPLAAHHDATYMWSDRGPSDTRELVPPASSRPKTSRALPV